MKNVAFWDVSPCASWKNRRFGESSASIVRVTRIGELRTTLAVTSNRRTLLTANVVLTSPTPVTLMMEAIRCSETSVLTRVTRRNIPEDVLHSQSMFLPYCQIGNFLIVQKYRQNYSSVLQYC
jgi:hypothetical protein